jgi:hypothetical protein
MSDNPFPESEQKAYLRRLHLKYLSDHKRLIGRGLAYLGLPSAKMLDIKVWKPVLDHITAIERDPRVALSMYRTAHQLGVRDKTSIVEKSLYEAVRLLAMDETDIHIYLPQLYPSEREIIQKVREISHDVINIDLCGGFLYPRSDGSSENTETLKHILAIQARHKSPFILITTFSTRDTGKDDYDYFISETLDQLIAMGIDASKVKEFYLAKNITDQPRNLRRLRFCVPAFLQKTTLNDFRMRGYKAWYYKTFYHALLVFEPRKRGSALGLAWPPIDEFEEVLNMPLLHIGLSSNDEVILTELPTPPLRRLN